MSIFDVNEHVGRVPKDYRDADQLQDVVDQIEREILERFTVTEDYGLECFALSVDPPLYVALRGYNSAVAEMEAHLKEVFISAIAEAVPWRTTLWKKSPLVGDSSNSDKTSVTYRRDANEPLPATVTRWFKNFDLRPVVHTL